MIKEDVYRKQMLVAMTTVRPMGNHPMQHIVFEIIICIFGLKLSL